jgi:hypothetical protein
MLSRKSLFQGNSDIQMLASITNVLGTIKWNECEKLPDHFKIKTKSKPWSSFEREWMWWFCLWNDFQITYFRSKSSTFCRWAIKTPLLFGLMFEIRERGNNAFLWIWFF